MNTSFVCGNCGATVITEGFIGTKNRNHCPYCLFSKHLDSEISGDRSSNCKGLMMPVSLTYKSKGEIALVHECLKCSKLSINRIAADDNSKKLYEVFNLSKKASDVDEEDLKHQLGL